MQSGRSCTSIHCIKEHHDCSNVCLPRTMRSVYTKCTITYDLCQAMELNWSRPLIRKNCQKSLLDHPKVLLIVAFPSKLILLNFEYLAPTFAKVLCVFACSVCDYSCDWVCTFHRYISPFVYYLGWSNSEPICKFHFNLCIKNWPSHRFSTYTPLWAPCYYFISVKSSWHTILCIYLSVSLFLFRTLHILYLCIWASVCTDLSLFFLVILFIYCICPFEHLSLLIFPSISWSYSSFAVLCILCLFISLYVVYAL